MIADGDETEYALVMPFVACRSEGGPHDDAAFTAGYRLGAADEKLRAATSCAASTVRLMVLPDEVPQLDLIAMRHGFRLRTLADETGWVHAFLRATP